MRNAAATCRGSTACGRSPCSRSSPTTSTSSWAEGGLLGVGVFFTLSGYLITDILLNQVNRGGIRLKSFWLARARRLLPALFVILIVVLAWVTLIGPHQPSTFRMEAVSSAAYFNNWWLILHNASYFERFQLSPLDHLWSLSIEEQFYIVWPFLLMLGTRFVREPKRTPAGSGCGSPASPSSPPSAR